MRDMSVDEYSDTKSKTSNTKKGKIIRDGCLGKRKINCAKLQEEWGLPW